MSAAQDTSAPRTDAHPAVATPARPVVRALRATPHPAAKVGLPTAAGGDAHAADRATPATRYAGAPQARASQPPPGGEMSVPAPVPRAGAAAADVGLARVQSPAATGAGAAAQGAASTRRATAADAPARLAGAPGDGDAVDLAALLHELRPALEEPRLRPAALSIASILAFRLGFERVSIGVARGGAVTLVAVSDAPDLAPRAPLARALQSAMVEAVGQDRPLLHGAGEPGALFAHRALATEGGARLIVSLPLRHGAEPCGVLLCERLRAEAVSPACRHACEALAGTIAPALELKRRDAAGGWARRVRGRAAAVAAALAATAALALLDVDYRVSAPARVEGAVQRAMVAPFDGYVESAHARAGDRVAAGEVLATLQQSALVLERDTHAAEREEFAKQYQRAMAARDWAEARVLEARMAQAAAKVDLIDARIARTRISAPFDGVVLSGDLGRSLGAPVARGDRLFEVAPLDGQRIVLQADERDVGDLAPGMRGTLALAALPDAPIPLTVERVSGAARTEAGGPVFLVEARLDGAVPAALRPGMEGVAKVTVEPRALLWIVSHRLVEWLWLRLWTLLP